MAYYRVWSDLSANTCEKVFILNEFPRENVREGNKFSKQRKIFGQCDILNVKYVFNGVV